MIQNFVPAVNASKVHTITSSNLNIVLPQSDKIDLYIFNVGFQDCYIALGAAAVVPSDTVSGGMIVPGRTGFVIGKGTASTIGAITNPGETTKLILTTGTGI